jgi:EAL domain-containing protein (putative c-di-GMP-specific phosphodiesterase class I)
MKCARCDCLPQEVTDQAGILEIGLPLNHSLAKLMKVARSLEIPARRITDGCALELTPGKLRPLVDALDETLSEAEQLDARARFRQAAESVQGSLFSSERLRSFMSRVRDGWLLRVLAENQLTAHFQPIVAAAHPEQVYAYECLLRGRLDGQLVYPGKLLDAAKRMDALFQLDRRAREAAIRTAANHNIQQKIFINFTPTAIYDPEYCLRSTIELITQLNFKPEQIVFEVIESEQVNDVAFLRRILDYYRKAGFKVALDDLGSGYSSLTLLDQLRPDYVKIDMGLVRDVHKDRFRGMLLDMLLEMCNKLQMPTIAEGIETAEEAAWLQSHGAQLLQGYFFAKPAAVPPVPANVQAKIVA